MPIPATPHRSLLTADQAWQTATTALPSPANDFKVGYTRFCEAVAYRWHCSVHSAKWFLCPHHVEIVLQEHPRVLQLLPEVRTEHLDFIRGPSPSILVYTRSQAFEVIQQLNKIEGPDFLELLILGPSADREGEGARFHIRESSFADPAFDLRSSKGLVYARERARRGKAKAYPGSGSLPNLRKPSAILSAHWLSFDSFVYSVPRV